MGQSLFFSYDFLFYNIFFCFRTYFSCFSFFVFWVFLGKWFCPGIFAPALVPGQRDSGIRKYFCTGTKGQRNVPSQIVPGHPSGCLILWKLLTSDSSDPMRHLNFRTRLVFGLDLSQGLNCPSTLKPNLFRSRKCLGDLFEPITKHLLIQARRKVKRSGISNKNRIPCNENFPRVNVGHREILFSLQVFAVLTHPV